MKKGGLTTKKTPGFTIVETMIVLAVSGALLSVAMVFINGRQAKTEFQIGVRDVQTKIQQVINEVNSGYYPPADFDCNHRSSGGQDIVAGATAQGQHGTCIFTGKALVLQKDTVSIFSLAGNRQTNAGGINTDVTTPQQAEITAISRARYGGAAQTNQQAPEITQQYNLPNGLQIVGYREAGVMIPNGEGFRYGFAVMNSFAKASDSMAGSQTVDLRSFTGGNGLSPVPLYTFTNLGPGDATENMAGVINEEWKRGPAAYPERDEIRICVRSGGTQQSAWIIIGSMSGGTAVRTEIRSGIVCA